MIIEPFGGGQKHRLCQGQHSHKLRLGIAYMTMKPIHVAASCCSFLSSRLESRKPTRRRLMTVAGTRLPRPEKRSSARRFRPTASRPIFFDGLPWKGKPTRVFAWVGVPKLEPNKKAPGIVLVHGGGGTAFDAWVRLWVSRGYAAIAMDTCGCVPKGTYGNWQRHDAGGPPGWGGFEQADEPMEDQWPYHAVTDVILAHSLLRAMPEVDDQRVGVTGISWGGYLTCIASGLDDRFQFAVPVYGCGFLGEDSAWVPEFKKMGTKGDRWLAMWDPSHYLKSGMMPKLWVTGTNDFAYPMNALQKSYRLAGGVSTPVRQACECRTATMGPAKIRLRSSRSQTQSWARNHHSP